MALEGNKIYKTMLPKWEKYRLTYDGEEEFIDKYLERFSTRESEVDYQFRKKITYNPAHASVAIDEIQKAFYTRMYGISRVGGSASYQSAIMGYFGGVDKEGSTMNRFINSDVLSDLLVLGKVGVFVDRDEFELETLQVSDITTPYLYSVPAENILDWKYDNKYGEGSLTYLLIRDFEQKDGQTIEYYREFTRLNPDGSLNNKVTYNVYDSAEKLIETKTSNLEKIPFAIAELSKSLMKDICRYQISLLNLSSSDMVLAFKGNYPIYTEQSSNIQDSEYQQSAHSKDVTSGVSYGKRYPQGTERPEFINPSPDPLRVSMEKQLKMEKDIRILVGLSVTTLEPRQLSATAKEFDSRSLESGLAVIGLELQHLESQIAELWAMYDGSRDSATIKYPEDYTLKTDTQRQSEAQTLTELKQSAPSALYQRDIAKLISRTLLEGKVTVDRLQDIYDEIDSNPIPDIAQETLDADITNSVLSPETAAQAKGYPKGEAERAALAHADRAKAIVEAQTSVKNQENAIKGSGGVVGEETSRDNTNSDDLNTRS